MTPGASNDDQLARVWIDMTNHERVTLYIVDGTWERVLVRHLARNENPEVTWEGLGHIVELAMVALRAGETIGIGRETLRAQLVPPPPPPPPEPYVFVPIVAPRPALRFHAGAFYETALQGSGPQIAMGPGIVLELEKSAPRASYGVALTAQYRLPLTVDEGIARVRTEGAALRGLVTFGLPLSRSNVLTPALGAGVDVVHSEAIGARTTALRLVPPQTDAIPVLRAQLRFEHRAPGLRLFGGAGLDVPFDNRRYVLAKADSREVLYAPWAVRPFVFAGVETP
ncbi:hypothetical protein AKJ09_05519 [Labilithrix luteola]|uniref:Uncharacterized protein n=1 Tax=Labilithrix luteola TaxID=1391654 RepID=A0A0K1PZ94_9BACT|nr:hypothetical protein AKJ09_05519 [Labilithrix luteola]